MPAAGGEEVLVLLLADIDAAAAAADQDAGVRLPRAQACVAPRFAPRDDAEQRCPRVALRVRSPVEVIVTVEWQRGIDRKRRDGCGDAARIRRCVELGDRARPADTATDVAPETITAGAERRHHADS